MDAPALKSWLVDRLTRGEQDWRTLLEAGFEQLLDSPFDVVVPREAGTKAVLEFIHTKRFEELVRPGVKLVLPLFLARTHKDGQPLRRWVPPATEQKIVALAERDGWIDPRWVEAIYELDVAEELVADTLYNTLRDFSTIVPRIVQSVMPSPLGKLAKLGGKATGGVTGRVLDEVERRLEAEIKKFLEKGTRRALDRAARFTIEHVDDRAAKDARRDLTRFVLERSPEFHTRVMTDDVVAELDPIVEEIAAHVAALPETKTVIEETVERIYERFSGQTVREVFASIGIEQTPPYDLWVEASWPVVQRVLDAPGIDAWLLTLCEEIVAEVAPASNDTV